MTNEAIFKLDGIDPFGLFVLSLCHVIDRDHIAMGNEHVEGVVQNLRIQTAVLSDPVMVDCVPFLHIFLDARSVETYPIAPKMS
mgnify:CR=1 FL=1